MRVLVLLFLAAACGFLVGRLTAPEGRGRGGGRSAPAPLPGQPVAAADQPPQVAEPPPPARIDELAPPAGVVPSSGPAEDTGDDGLLLVDLCGLQRAWVGNVDIVGAYETEEIDALESGPARFQGAAGTYDVWWLDRDGQRLGTRAKLDSGRVTRVRVTDHRTAPPIPRGLGVLGVFVEAAEGGGLCADVGIADGRHSMTVYTNADGYASTVIRPGRYLLSVGHRRSEAVVEEGRVAAHRIAHDREGDLVSSLTGCSTSRCMQPAN